VAEADGMWRINKVFGDTFATIGLALPLHD
jgi:hypothetical protein